jgi:hypothetical protein
MSPAEVAGAPETLQGDPAVEGIWELLDYRLPFPAAHAALLRTEKVLLMPGGRRRTGANSAPRACLWDWHSGTLRTWALPSDFSLGAQCFLPDGRLLLTGGGCERSAIRLKESYLFDPASEEFLRVSDMPERGPCPTLIEQGDGTVLAVGGAGRSRIHVYERTSGWTTTDHSELDWPLYPQLTLLAGGSIFYSGQHFGGRALIGPGVIHPGSRLVELPQEAFPPDFLFDFREQGATVPMPPVQDQRVMMIGGGSPPSPDVKVADFSRAEPALRAAEPMHFGRASFNAVVLPDHTIVVCGGVRSDQGGRSPAVEAELYDPSTGVWTTAAAAQVPREGHSSAILLPDGRVLTAGSTDASGHGELGVELYHPPYLFRGNRPVVEEVPAEVNLGGRFWIKTADSDIRRLSLVKPMAASHGADSGQRLVDLPFESRGSGVLEAVAPENPNIAPPGQYLLFLLNHKGTPSYGKWMLLKDPSRSRRGTSSESHDEPGTSAENPWKSVGRHSWNGSASGAGRVRPIGEPQVSSTSEGGTIAWDTPPGVPEPDESLRESSRELRPLVPGAATVSPATGPIQRGPTLFDEPSSAIWFEPPASSSPPREPANPPWLEEPADPPWLEEPANLPSAAEAARVESLVARDLPLPEVVPGSPSLEEQAPLAGSEEHGPHTWLDEPAGLVWDETSDALAQDKQRLGALDLPSPTSAPLGPWYKWARPALIIGAAGLLALSMVIEAATLRAVAAFIFLLFAPGMALVGLYRPSGWASEVALAVGLSVAVETLLTVASLYFGIWSADGILLTLVGLSLSGATVQLMKAAFGWRDRLGYAEGSGEAPA